MANTVKIGDGSGDGKIAKVVNDGALLTSVVPFPPLEEREQLKIFREYLTQDGDGSTFDMRVDGSTTPVEFYIQSDPEDDIHIHTLSFVIAGPGAALNEFANITALSNGCLLTYQDEQGEIITISNDL